MRDRTPATEVELDAAWTAAEVVWAKAKVQLPLMLQRRARAYMESRVADGDLVARSVTLYVERIAAILKRYGDAFGAVMSPTGARLIAHLRSGLDDATNSSFDSKLDRALLRLLIAHGVFDPMLSPREAGAIARHHGEVSDVGVSLVDLYFTDRAARKMLDVTKSLVAERRAPETLVMRTAMVTMCRWAGALPADLAAMTFNDLTIDPADDPTADPDDARHKWKVASRLKSAGPNEISVLLLPPTAERALGYWLTLRARLTGVDAPQPGDLVFIHPKSHEPLPRREVSKIITGENLAFQEGTDGLWDPTTLTTTQTPSEIMPEGPPMELPEKAYLSALRLRECHLIALIREHQWSTPVLDKACEEALGTRCYLARGRTRKLLGITGRTPETRPRKPRAKAGRVAPARATV